MKKKTIVLSSTAAAAVSLGLFLACAKGGTSTGGGSVSNFTGTWSGPLSYSIGGCAAAGRCQETLVITQSTTAFSGQDECAIGNAPATIHPSTGTVGGGSFQLKQAPYSCGGSAKASATFACTATSSATLACSLSGTGCDNCNNPSVLTASGTLTMMPVGF